MADTPVPPAQPRRLSQQNEAMGQYITEAGVLITTALTDAEIAAILASKSYDAAKLGAGQALQSAAQAAYNGRQSALGGRLGAVSDQQAMFDEEKAEFDAFRTLARPFFTDKGDRTEMRLNAAVPHSDMAEFVTFARTAYTNAKAAPYQAILAPLGYDTAQLDLELNELTAFENQMSGRQSAGGGAQASTGDRNTAFRALKTWMDQFEGVCKAFLGPLLTRLPFDELPHVSVPKA